MSFTSKYYKSTDAVSLVRLGEYSDSSVREALSALLSPIGGLDFIKEGMRVVIKANLVSAMKPSAAATTHPTLIAALCDLITERGASVVVGDSPGGLYNAAFVGRVYKVTGMHELESHGATLNTNFETRTAFFEEASILRDFSYTSYLDDADLIINFCKVKSHGMMGMSCAAKNMFGVIPGVIKPEYHFRFPKYEDFADMICDLNEYFHPTLSIADGVVGMEGNGPTAGVPREIGCLIASRSPHNLDMIAAKILGFEPFEIPTLEAAHRRGLVPDRVEEIPVFGDVDSLVMSDFERVVERRSMQFEGDGKNPIKRLFGKLAGAVLRTRPTLRKRLCVGCKMCAEICPAKAINMKNGKAKVDYKRCIRCFCCQEFCPKSAMKVGRTPIAALFHKEKKK